MNRSGREDRPAVEPVLTEREVARAAAILIGVLAVFGLAGIVTLEIWRPGDLRPDYHPAIVLSLVAGSLLAVAVFVRRPDLLDIRRVPLGLAIAAFGIAVAAWFSGPTFSPYVAMSFMWIGMFAFLLLRRSHALLIVVWVAVLYGIQVALQAGNAGPLTRWLIVVGAVIVSGMVVGSVADRVRDLRDSEHALRIEVEDVARHLEEADRQRREFLAGMSHELRTPLNAIIGFADILRDGLFGILAPAQEPLVARIQAAGATLLGLVGEVLALDQHGAPAPSATEPAVAPSADRDPVLSADPRGALAFFVLVPLGLATLPRTPPEFHIVGVAVIAAVGVVIDMLILLSRRLRARVQAAAHVIVVTLVATGIAFSIGPTLSPFATMFFLWMATAAAIRLSRRGAAAELVLISLCEGAVVTLQRGNVAAAFRWEVTTATLVVSSFVIRMVVDRLFEATDREAAMRHAADDTRSRLESANQHKVDFLRSVRLELRSPVDDVTSAASALLDGTGGTLADKQAEYARDIDGAARQLWSLVTDILDLATLESGAMTVDVVDVGIADVVHEAMENHVGPAEARHLAVDVDVEPRDARAWADPDKLRRAVAGLVSNAVKFTSPGGGIHVKATVDHRCVTISVADTGRGIPIEDQVRIFDGFQQGVSAMMSPGAGVGLTLARRFVELQGGALDVVSAPGVGSTFTITLPTFDRPASALAKAPVP